MKVLLCLFLTMSLGCQNVLAFDSNIRVSKLNEVDVDEVPLDYSLLTNLEREQRLEYNNFLKDYNLISKAKFKIINGDLRMAEFYLNQINDQTTSFFLVKARYISLIKFINGRYKESLEILEAPQLNNIGQFSKVCMVKIINMMALNKTDQLKEEAVRCMGETEKFSKNDQYWLDTMIKLKLKDSIGLKRNMMTDVEQTLNNDEMSRLWLKTGLYLNKESELIGILSLLPEQSYQSKKIREIIAFMYLRKGEKDKAISFIDDVDSANAENIKGNINLYDKQFELAFGHFKLALMKKSDSENALERGLPLAWLLNQFEDGLSMLNNVSNRNLDERKKMAIKVAFLIRLKKFDEAADTLTILKNKFQNISPFEVNLMDTYLQLMMASTHESKNRKIDKRKIEETSEAACKSFDGINCWIALSLVHWDNLGKTIKREEVILNEKEVDLENLKKPMDINPLKEAISIDQKDIEELDSDLVKLPTVSGK